MSTHLKLRFHRALENQCFAHACHRLAPHLLRSPKVNPEINIKATRTFLCEGISGERRPGLKLDFRECSRYLLHNILRQIKGIRHIICISQSCLYSPCSHSILSLVSEMLYLLHYGQISFFDIAFALRFCITIKNKTRFF